MAMRSGAAAQLGFAAEPTWGTRTAPTDFLPLVEESLDHERERLESEGIIAGVTVLGSEQWNGGNVTVGGDVGLELYTEGLDLLLEHMFGTVDVTGTGPYVRTYKPAAGSIDGKGLTIQIGRPGVGGVVHPFDVVGAKIAEWEIACSEGEIATLGLTIVARSMVTGQTLAVPTYLPGATKPFKFNHGKLTIAGQPVKITEATVSGDNGLKDDRRFIVDGADGEIDEPLEESLREYTGEVTAEFVDLTQYQRFVDGTEHPFVLNFTAGAAQLEIAGNVRLDGGTPQVSGREILEQSLPVKFVRPAGSVDDGDAISVTTTTSVAP